MKRSRPALIAVAAVAVEAIAVAALGNPSVSDALARQANRSGSTGRDALLALTTFAWPTGRGETSTVEFAGPFVAIGVLLVLGFLLVLGLVRGHPRPGQVWFLTWLSVLAAVAVAVMAGGAFADPGSTSRVDHALFASVTAGTVLFGLALGVLCAAAAVLTHVATRQDDTGAAGSLTSRDGAIPAAGYGYRPAEPPAGGVPTTRLPGPDAEPAPHGATTRLPPYDEVDDQVTLQLPPRDPVWASETAEIERADDRDRDGSV